MAERIVSPGVFTRERDLSFLPQGIAEMQETAPKVNLSGGKNQDKQEESARTENRAGNEPAANPTGDRENE